MSSVQELERQSNVLVICHEVGDAVLCKTFIPCMQASMYMAKKNSLHASHVVHQAVACPCFVSVKRLGVFPLPPLDGMLLVHDHRRVTPSPPPPPPVAFNSLVPIYTPRWRETLRVKVRTLTTRSRDELNNMEATVLSPSPCTYSWSSLSSYVEIKIGSLYSTLHVGYLAVSHGVLFGPQLRLVARMKFNLQNCNFCSFWKDWRSYSRCSEMCSWTNTCCNAGESKWQITWLEANCVVHVTRILGLFLFHLKNTNLSL